MESKVLPFRPRTDAPVQPLPREHFGRKPTAQDRFDALVHGYDDTLPRAEDRAQQERVKRAAREARNAFDQTHVCPSLKADLAARIRGVAQQLEALSAEAKAYGLLSTRVALNEHAGLLEGEAALVEAG